MDISELLHCLDGVIQTSGGYMAKCPAHEDRRQSLTVTSGKQNQILIHCFAGCDIHQIVDSLGLTISDLYPESVKLYRPSKHPKLSALDLLRVIDFESEIVLIAADTLANGYGLSASDYQRLELARDRIMEARKYA